jgi:hypothetical protein
MTHAHCYEIDTFRNDRPEPRASWLQPKAQPRMHLDDADE